MDRNRTTQSTVNASPQSLWTSHARPLLLASMPTISTRGSFGWCDMFISLVGVVQEVVMIVEAAIVVVLVAPAGRWTTQWNFGVAQENRFLGVVVTVYEILGEKL
jgi:hypothetical protein